MPLPAPSNLALQHEARPLRASQPRLRYWHEAIIDDMLAFPRATIKERALRLGYSASYLGTIMSSDMFVAAYEARRAHYSDILTLELTNKLASVAGKHLDILGEQLDKKRDQIPFAQVAESAMGVLEKLGFGAPPPASPGASVNVQVNQGQAPAAVQPASAEVLAEARLRLRDVERTRLMEAKPAPQDAPVTYEIEEEASGGPLLEGGAVGPREGSSDA